MSARNDTLPRFLRPISAKQQMDEALHGVKWDTTVQDPDEAQRMRAYVRFAERNNGGPVEGTCKTCAFRSGTEANGSAAVLEMIELQMLTGGMFNCHAGLPINPANGCTEDEAKAGPCRGFVALRNL